MRGLQHITRQTVGAVLAALALVAFLGALLVAKDHGEAKTAAQIDTNVNVSKQLDTLKEQLDRSQRAREALAGDRARWQAQITTSIDQLLAAGEQPIIVAPDAVAPNLKPPTTTTTEPASTPPPLFVFPPTTEPPPTTTTNPPPPITEPPTTEPPPTTTTTEPETTTTTTTPEVSP
jgi:hypothetical protein